MLQLSGTQLEMVLDDDDTQLLERALKLLSLISFQPSCPGQVAAADAIGEVQTVLEVVPRITTNLPARVCRVLEGYVAEGLTSKEPFEDMVYRFTHLAAGQCENPHEDWMDEFVELEKVVEEVAYTSPAEREKRDQGRLH